MRFDTIEEYALLVTMVVSVVAVVLNLISLTYTRRKLYNTTLTDKRIEWAVEVRKLLTEFVCFHIEKRDTRELFQKKLQLQMYFNLKSNPDQILLHNTMVECLNTGRLDIQLFMEQSAVVLANNWARIKKESKFKNWEEKHIRKEIYKGNVLEELRHEFCLDYFESRELGQEFGFLQQTAGTACCEEITDTKR